MRWSKKVAWMVGTSTWGMWQVMQLDLDWGQIFGVEFSCDLSSGIPTAFSTRRAEFFVEAAAEFCAVAAAAADEWHVRHLES